MSLDLLARLLRTTSRLSPKRQSLAEEKRYLLLSLKSVGFEVAGKGAFGVVLVRNGLAVKIVLTKESSGYLAYARMCRMGHAKNRLLPKVHAVWSVGRYSCVVMEKLYVSSSKSASLCPQLRRASRNRSYARQVGRLMGRMPGSSEQALLKIQKIIYVNAHSYWDIRSDNILFRKERGRLLPVLVDPIAF